VCVRACGRCTQIKTYSWDNAQVILVGNKSDLERERVVSTERGRTLANQLGTILTEISGLVDTAAAAAAKSPGSRVAAGNKPIYRWLDHAQTRDRPQM